MGSPRNSIVQMLAWLIRANPTLIEYQDDGYDDPASYLVRNGIVVGTDGSAIVIGRNLHAVHAAGVIANGGTIQMQTSGDGVVYANLGAAIAADGPVQLTSGLYRKLKAVIVAAGTATTLSAQALAGAVEVSLTSTANLPASGYVTLNKTVLNIRIHYTSIGGGKLLGVPASGPYSITATVANGLAMNDPVSDGLSLSLLSMRG